MPATRPDLLFLPPHDRPGKANLLPTHHNCSVRLVPNFADNRCSRQPTLICFSSHPSTAQEKQNLLPTHHNCSVRLIPNFADNRQCRKPALICFSSRPTTAQEKQNLLPTHHNCSVMLIPNFADNRCSWQPPPPRPSDPFYQILTELCR